MEIDKNMGGEGVIVTCRKIFIENMRKILFSDSPFEGKLAEIDKIYPFEPNGDKIHFEFLEERTKFKEVIEEKIEQERGKGFEWLI
ncbi:hypothetical protein KAR91_62955 [Candidatus Pacearchaeota archaeon]|nr:hypothetical protein [Candidatus Pacearchaeota archaeon]